MLPLMLAILSLIMAACASTSAASPYSNQPSAEATGSPNSDVALPDTGSSPVQVAGNQQFGQILVTTDGMTLYNFAIDTPEMSNCTTSACVAFWPPYLVGAQPTSEPNLPGKLSTITRPDGSKQVTYNGSPLYTFALDKNPGDANGDGVNEFGGIWHVVSIGSATTNTKAGSATTGDTGGYGYSP